MALSQNMTLQQLLAYANGGIAASASRCPTATAKYRFAAAQAQVALGMPEYAQFASKQQVLGYLVDADGTCDTEVARRTAVAPRPTPTPTPKPAPSPTPNGAPPVLKAGMPWWLWAGLAFGGVMLLKKGKKTRKKTSKRRKSTRRRRR